METTLNDEILLVLSIDVYYDNVDLHSTKHTIENLDLFTKIYEIIEKETSPYSKPKISWLVSDDEVILNKFDEMKLLIKRYDEIGLHCLISRDIQDLSSNEFLMKDYLITSISKLHTYGINPRSTRIAGCAGSNLLMKILSDIGIKVDSSAVPNRKRTEDVKFNWINTPTLPYYPSNKDYRIPEDEMLKCHNILEVPLTTIKIKTSYDKNPLDRYLDLCFKNNIIKNKIYDIIKQKLLVTIIHPMELLPSAITQNELFSGNMNDFRDNLSCILESCDRDNKKIKCVTLSELRSIFPYN